MVRPAGSSPRWKFQLDQAAPAARQQRGVGVEDGLVALVGDRAEDLPLGLAGVGQHRQRLVGVGGDHDLVELLALAAVGLDPRPDRAALDPPHRRSQPDPVAPAAR